MGGEAPADRVLLRRFCNGCYDSFEELVSCYERQVYGVALALLQDSDKAENILAGVFITLAQRAKELLDSPSLEHFLLRTLRDLIVAEQENESPSIQIAKQTSAQPTSQTRRLGEHLMNLPVQFSFIFVLRHVLQKEIAEISRIAEIPPRAVQLRLVRSYRLLERLASGDSPQSVWRSASMKDQHSPADI